MKKIYLFTPYPTKDDPTGHQFIEHRVNVLKKYYDITIITLKYSKKPEKRISYESFNDYSIITLNIQIIPIPKIRFFNSQYQIVKLLNTIIKKNPPNLIHVHFSSYHSWLVNKLCKKYKIPYIITEHASFFEKSINESYRGFKIKKAIKNADSVISVSKALERTIKKYITREIIIVPNVVDVNKFKISLTTSNTSDKIKIISVGGLDETDKKNYELLIKVLKKLQDNNYDIQCEIIGDGPYFEILKERIKEYNLNNTKLLGTVANDLLPNYYNEADFFVSSSKRETFGVAIVEAMSCGLPIVSTKSEGPEEFITKKVGMLSEHTLDSLYNNIVEMIYSYKLYDNTDIRDIVKKNYSEKVYLEKIKQIYDNLL